MAEGNGEVRELTTEEKLDVLLDAVEGLTERLDEITEKLDNLNLFPNDGFSVDS